MQLELNQEVSRSRSVRANVLEYRVGDSRPSPESVADRVAILHVACMLHAALSDRTLGSTLDYQDLLWLSLPNHNTVELEHTTECRKQNMVSKQRARGYGSRHQGSRVSSGDSNMSRGTAR